MKKRDIGQVFADNLRAEMKRQGLTQAALAKRAGYSQSVISEVLKCRVSPTINKVGKLGNALGVLPWTLLADSEAAKEEALRKMLGGGE